MGLSINNWKRPHRKAGCLMSFVTSIGASVIEIFARFSHSIDEKVCNVSSAHFWKDYWKKQQKNKNYSCKCVSTCMGHFIVFRTLKNRPLFFVWFRCFDVLLVYERNGAN